MKFHKLHLTHDVTGQHYRSVPSDVSLPRLSERRRRLKFRLGHDSVIDIVMGAKLQSIFKVGTSLIGDTKAWSELGRFHDQSTV